MRNYVVASCGRSNMKEARSNPGNKFFFSQNCKLSNIDGRQLCPDVAHQRTRLDAWRTNMVPKLRVDVDVSRERCRKVARPCPSRRAARHLARARASRRAACHFSRPRARVAARRVRSLGHEPKSPGDVSLWPVVPISPRGVSPRSGASRSHQAACHFGRPSASPRAACPLARTA